MSEDLFKPRTRTTQQVLRKNYDALKASYEDGVCRDVETTPMSKSGTIGESLADEIFADLSSFNDVDLMEQEIESVKAQEQDRLVFDLKDSFSVNEARVAVVAERTRALIVSHACTSSTKAITNHAVMKISLNDTKHRKVIPVRVCVCVFLSFPLCLATTYWYRYTATVFVM